MAQEIERKFLVKGNSWRDSAAGILYRQGYLSTEKGRVVRVRTMGERGFLTVKGLTKGFSRAEYEYEIPLSDADEMLEFLCKRPLIEKTRYKVNHKGVTWEVDEFLGGNKGLIVAEIELDNEDQKIEFPEWIGEEVSGNPKYKNSNLVENPYAKWKK